MIKNPCILKCFFNFKEGFCTGCYRQIDDIWDWSSKTDDQKLEIIENAKKLKQEKEVLERPDNAE